MARWSQDGRAPGCGWSQDRSIYRTTCCGLSSVYLRLVMRLLAATRASANSHGQLRLINGTVVARRPHGGRTITCHYLPPLYDHFDRSQVFEHNLIFARTFTCDYLSCVFFALTCDYRSQQGPGHTKRGDTFYIVIYCCRREAWRLPRQAKRTPPPLRFLSFLKIW